MEEAVDELASKIQKTLSVHRVLKPSSSLRALRWPIRTAFTYAPSRGPMLMISSSQKYFVFEAVPCAHAPTMSIRGQSHSNIVRAARQTVRIRNEGHDFFVVVGIPLGEVRRFDKTETGF